jgi:hypothetical protein
MERDIREINETAKQHAAERKRRQRETDAEAERRGSLSDQRIDALGDQVRDGFRAAGRITEAIHAELEALRIENIELKTNLARLEAEVAKLQTARAKRKPALNTIDVPSLRVAQ